MNKDNYVAIMAGGVGSRFWPASTEENPKQFLDIAGNGKSLIQMTYERFTRLVPQQNIFVVTNKKYKHLCLQHIPELNPENILCEPSRNNTGPCVAYTALRLQAINPEANFVIAPSDHIIAKEEEFISKIKTALDFVENEDAIVTLGIEPTRPDTGFGYIETIAPLQEGINKVVSFKEKPDFPTAQSYLSAGNYLWNAGIFIWKARNVVSYFKEYTPEITDVLCQDLTKFGTLDEQDYIDKVYPNTPNISVDYAILEKADNVYTIPANIGWSDLGTWSSLYDFIDDGKQETIVQSTAPSQYIDAPNSLIRIDENRNVIIRGLEDFIVVSNEHSLLIYPKSKEQELKESLKKMS